MFPRYHERVLCEGYSRHNSIQPIPYVINELCSKYFSNHIRCKIKESQIKQLNATKRFTTGNILLKSFVFKNKGITFKCYLTRVNDSIKFVVQIDKSQTKLENYTCVQFYFELYCKETNSHWKGKDWSATLGNANQWSNLAHWNDHTMNVSDCIDKKQLTFYYAIEILRVQYSSYSLHDNYKKPITLQKSIEFEWNINKKQLALYKNYVPNKYVWCSTEENGIFSPWFAPNGFHNGSNKMFYGIDVTGLFPDGIAKMNVKISVKDNKNNFMFESVNLFHENSVGGKTVSNIVYGNGTYSMNNVE
eukprot:304734_1